MKFNIYRKILESLRKMILFWERIPFFKSKFLAAIISRLARRHIEGIKSIIETSCTVLTHTNMCLQWNVIYGFWRRRKIGPEEVQKYAWIWRGGAAFLNWPAFWSVRILNLIEILPETKSVLSFGVEYKKKWGF